jgi:hypothetical protein
MVLSVRQDQITHLRDYASLIAVEAAIGHPV